MTASDRIIKETFVELVATFERLPAAKRNGRYLQTTKLATWLSIKTGVEVAPRTVVKLLEERGYHYIFEEGGFHHWVKQPE